MLDTDTIAAVSTALGVGAIAVVRVSGPGAAGVLGKLVRAESDPPAPRTATLVDLHDPIDGSKLDRAIATLFRAPASYTGEDLLELSCHGGWIVPELVLEACVAAGARRAEPGEFTRRAYLRGKIDLVQAEAIADLLGARSRALHRAALHQLDRGLSSRLAGLRERLVGLEALLTHHIDFPEEDDAPVPLDRIMETAADMVRDIDAMLATAPEGELLREGALTVLAGRPNVGKSSLYNALLGRERAIVTEEAGTTRDALETTVQLGGFPFRLVDTAGLREASGEVERLGIEVARRYLDRADLVLLCVPAGEDRSDAERAFLVEQSHGSLVVVETKADLVAAPEVVDPGEGDLPVVRVSAHTGQGLDQLRMILPELAFRALVSVGVDSPVVTNRRHATALEKARAEVDAFRTALSDGLPAEVASTHLRPAETALEELLGVVSVDDVLDVVFREFCVGK